MQKVLSEDRFGVRPGSKIHKLTLEEEKEELKTLEEWNAIEEAEAEAELKALKEKYSVDRCGQS
jgi:hypothetical protein